ncbi:MAG TPA: GntR family transcriptional regulator [Streptosporangiaceae bacterium]|jgi:DNA-binding GntR family transcriptional regulator
MPKPTQTRPAGARAVPASHKVKLVLHHGIVTGTIPGGTRLVQSSIAEEMAVSTRPVRDALRELAAEGFVRLDDRGGAVVHELCQSELRDIYEIRMMLEPIATARTAKLAGKESLLRAAGLLAAMESDPDCQQWAAHNSAFHNVIAEAGNSAKMVAILSNLRELSARYITHSITAMPDRAGRANAEHAEILRAIIAGDSEAAADAALRHLDGTLRALCFRPVGAR